MTILGLAVATGLVLFGQQAPLVGTSELPPPSTAASSMPAASAPQADQRLVQQQPASTNASASLVTPAPAPAPVQTAPPAQSAPAPQQAPQGNKTSAAAKRVAAFWVVLPATGKR